MTNLQRKIGQRVRTFRNARNLTIHALADAAQLSVDYVNKLELGRYMPSAATLLAIAAALEVPVAMLFPDPLRQAAEKGRALDELTAYCAKFDAIEVRYLLRVIAAVMDRP